MKFVVFCDFFFENLKTTFVKKYRICRKILLKMGGSLAKFLQSLEILEN